PDIQIHQAVVQFVDGRLEVPAQSDIDAEVALDAPIVVHKSIQPRGAVIFVGIAVGDGTGGGNALQEIGEIVSGEGAGEDKPAARILLGQLIEIEPPEISAKGEVVLTANPDQVLADLVGAVVI